MERCKTCKWWRVPDDEFRRYGEARRCHSPKVVFVVPNPVPPHYEWSELVRKGAAYSDAPRRLADDEAGVMDGEGYKAELWPGPDFGCVHHERENA